MLIMKLNKSDIAIIQVWNCEVGYNYYNWKNLLSLNKKFGV